MHTHTRVRTPGAAGSRLVVATKGLSSLGVWIAEGSGTKLFEHASAPRAPRARQATGRRRGREEEEEEEGVQKEKGYYYCSLVSATSFCTPQTNKAAKCVCFSFRGAKKEEEGLRGKKVKSAVPPRHYCNAGKTVHNSGGGGGGNHCTRDASPRGTPAARQRSGEARTE